jgi:hypothetical protein
MVFKYGKDKRNLAVPMHYSKQADFVFAENQKTIEKNWSHYKPLYEITDELLKKLRDANVVVNPENAAIVIDCWEKIAVNDYRFEGKGLPVTDMKKEFTE